MELRRKTKPYEGYSWHEQHKEELKEYARNYRANNPEYKARNAEKAKQDRLADPEFFKAREFAREMKKYGTVVEWYRDRLIEQFGTCALCCHLNHTGRGLNRLTVDHNHACCDLHTKSCGKCLRGLLCERCNLRLSYLEAIRKECTLVPLEGTWTSLALQYLKKYTA